MRSHGRLTSIFIAGSAACTVFAATFGLAATLDESSGGFGANTEMIASCGNGMRLGYTTELFTGLSAVDGIELSNIPAGCLGKDISLTFYDSVGSDIGSAITTTLHASGRTQNISIAPRSNTIDASQVSGISAVIP